MKRALLIAACAGVLSGCQAVTGTSGQLTGVTLPPGCKGQFTIMITAGTIVNATVSGSCDETTTVASSAVRFDWSPKSP